MENRPVVNCAVANCPGTKSPMANSPVPNCPVDNLIHSNCPVSNFLVAHCTVERYSMNGMPGGKLLSGEPFSRGHSVVEWSAAADGRSQGEVNQAGSVLHSPCTLILYPYPGTLYSILTLGPYNVFLPWDLTLYPYPGTLSCILTFCPYPITLP